MEHLLSVIVPVYNSEKYLQRCIESIINQSYASLEIIFIDDGSSDSSSKILDKYSKEDSRIRIIHQKNSGSSAARNRGLKQSAGDLIAFVDSDDAIDKDMYEILIHNLDDSNSEVSACTYKKELNSEFKILGKQKQIPQYICFNGECEIFESITSDANSIEGQLWNKVWKREVIKGITFREDLSITEDSIFTWQTMHNVSRVCYVPLQMYHYQLIGNSLMHKPNVDRAMTAIHGYEMMMQDAKTISQTVYDNLAVEYVGWNLTAFKNLILQDSPNMKIYAKIKADLIENKEYWGRSGGARKILEKSIANNYIFSKLLVKTYLRIKR